MYMSMNIIFGYKHIIWEDNHDKFTREFIKNHKGTIS